MLLIYYNYKILQITKNLFKIIFSLIIQNDFEILVKSLKIFLQKLKFYKNKNILNS